MPRLLRVALPSVLLVFLALSSTYLVAQTDLGAVQGHIQDQQNRPIGGASITLKNPNTSFNRTVQTDSSGFYSFIGVPVTGNYVLNVNAPQFIAAEQRAISLRAGGTAVFDFNMAVSGGQTQVDVYGTTATVPTESNQIATRLSQEKIENMPVFQRKITSLPLLNSSVRPSTTTGDLFLNEDGWASTRRYPLTRTGDEYRRSGGGFRF